MQKPARWEQAVTLLREAFAEVMDMALNNDPYPCYLIGNAYYFNDMDAYSDQPDTMDWPQKERLRKQKAKLWFLRAADLSLAHAMNNLAIIYEEEGDLPRAMKYLQLAAGDVRSYAWLGGMYMMGWGVKQDLQAGMDLLVRGIEAGRADSAEARVKKDYKKYALQAAQGGCADAYLYGDDVEKNEPLAVEVFEQGMAVGSRKCAKGLADCYYYGLGCREGRAQVQGT